MLHSSRFCGSLLLTTALAATLVASRSNAADIDDVELHVLPSTTLTDEQFLKGEKSGTSVLVGAELRIPLTETRRLPAVVLLHGLGGASGLEDDWVAFLNELDVATLLLDSVTGRRKANTNEGPQLPRLVQMEDAYRALQLLAKHPRIDPARIMLMGFSRGGLNALYASLRRFQRMHGPADAAFAAFVAFYPLCNIRFIGDEDVVGKPIRIFHGTADDYTPVEPCRAYVKRLVDAGKDVKLVEYPDAQHLFDWKGLKTPQKLSNSPTPRRCRLEEAPEGRIVNVETRQPFSNDDRCVERGPTIAYQAAAATEARKAVRQFIETVLKQ